MHELPVVNSILQVVLKHAAANKVKKVFAIHIQVGEMSDMEDEWMQKYFDYLATDEIVKGARLVIERIPVVMECSDCGKSYTVDMKSDQTMECPECGSANCSMVSGQKETALLFQSAVSEVHTGPETALGDLDFPLAASNTATRMRFRKVMAGIINFRSNGEELCANRWAQQGYQRESFRSIDPAQ